MPEEQNLESVRAFFAEVLNAGDLGGLDRFAHRDVAVPQSSPGIESLRSLLSEARATFPSPRYKVVDHVAQGEKVVVRFAARATHAGRYMGIPATGKTIDLWGVMIFRFEAGAIAEFWSLFDAQGILRQLRGA